MTDMLIRDLDEQTLEQLKARIQRHGRSLQDEGKLVLKQAAGADQQQVSAILDPWEQRFAAELSETAPT
jgi:plasmid stability protein